MEQWWSKDATKKKRNESAIPAGYALLLQQIVHDLSWSPEYGNISLDQNDYSLRNLDLRTLYGSPYKPTQQVGLFKLGFGENPMEPDIPREEQGAPNVGDIRNIYSVPMAQFTLGFLKFHNHTVRNFDKDLGHPNDRPSARQLVQWHYEWIILNDLLPRVCGQPIDSLWADYRSWKRDNVTEYQPTGALGVLLKTPLLRILLGMQKKRYRLNEPLQFIRMMSDHGCIPLYTPVIAKHRNKKDSLKLKTNEKLPPFWSIQWDLWLTGKTNGLYCPTFQLNNLNINSGYQPYPKYSTHQLVQESIKEDLQMGIMDGKSIARQFDIFQHPSVPDQAPLWYYILAEAEEFADGQHLGPLGSRLLSRYLLTLIDRNPHAHIHTESSWAPSHTSHAQKVTEY
ncbi:MAG: hypothetical protein HRU40_20960 [Saprospiraceae bacterium]|nr:hypothetical protein [Saprospiraceae bacterium]